MEQQEGQLPQANSEQEQVVAQLQAQANPEPQHFVEQTPAENVELQGKIGEYGSYSVDLRPTGDVVSSVDASISKAFFGFLTVEGSGKVNVTADLLGGLLALAEKSNQSWLVAIAGKLRSVSGR